MQCKRQVLNELRKVMTNSEMKLVVFEGELHAVRRWISCKHSISREHIASVVDGLVAGGRSRFFAADLSDGELLDLREWLLWEVDSDEEPARRAQRLERWTRAQIGEHLA